MSMVGLSREIAAITNTKANIKYPEVKTANVKDPLNINIKPNYKILPRVTSVIIENVTVKSSPEWLQKRIIQVGLRPINNLVDITNYVLWTHGSLLHVFDYDKINNHLMSYELSKGGENFRSLDGLDYKLPKNSIIVKDTEKIIDLIPLKGGENTASYSDTKNVLLHSIVCDPVLTRRTSQALKLRSDSSVIAERGLDPNGTVIAVNHALYLILELAGGRVASKIFDHKAKDFKPWQIKLDQNHLNKILGIKIADKEVINILEKLNLSPKLIGKYITCTIPTYRGDLKIEEDLIEEVARIYGYNNFPKTMPSGTIAKDKVPYYFDSSFNLKLKAILVSSGYSEVMNLSLISEDLINKCKLDTKDHIKLKNPVSIEYQYMRSSLIPGLLGAIKLNNEENIKLFEINKVYEGIPGKTREPYKLASITTLNSYRDFKGVIDLILERLNINSYQIDFEAPSTYWHPSRSGTIKIGNDTLGFFGEIHPEVSDSFQIKGNVFAFELDVKNLKKHLIEVKFLMLSNYPAQVEDITLSFSEKTKIKDVVDSIRSSDKLISEVNLIDTYKDSYTFRIIYQSYQKTLDDSEIATIRRKFVQVLKQNYNASLK